MTLPFSLAKQQIEVPRAPARGISHFPPPRPPRTPPQADKPPPTGDCVTIRHPGQITRSGLRAGIQEDLTFSHFSGSRITSSLVGFILLRRIYPPQADCPG